MTVARSRLPRLLRLAAGVCLAASTIAMSGAPAQARGAWQPHYGHARVAARHHHGAFARHAAPARNVATGDSNFSAIVIDATTGREIYGVNENGLRHPASITKVMTLYLLFEQLDKGAMTLQTQIPISEHAAAQEPSKLGIAAGDSISVEDAIKAVVTRSANDIAVAIAEAIGHDEDNFAAMMTRKAHSLGMSRTIYRNASGLPNDEQITTARDLTILARATEQHFPRYFKYYSTHEFTYDGEVIGNHNHLLGRVDGVDGIKTGYTRASGFNLLTSVHKDGRSLVAVVMGGRSAPARDRIMEQLIEDHLAEASVGANPTMVADNEPADAEATPVHQVPARLANAPARHAEPAIAQGDNNEEDDTPAKPLAAAPTPPARVAAVEPPKAPVVAAKPVLEAPKVMTEAPKAAIEPPKPAMEAPKPPMRVASASPEALGWVKGPEGAAKSAAPTPAARPRDAARKDDNRDETRVARNDDAPRANGKDGWVIQIGATDDASKANDLLIKARAQNRSTLASAKAVTEKVKKGEDVFYRARFAGLDSATAEKACASLKRGGFSCFATHDVN